MINNLSEGETNDDYFILFVFAPGADSHIWWWVEFSSSEYIGRLINWTIGYLNNLAIFSLWAWHLHKGLQPTASAQQQGTHISFTLSLLLSSVFDAELRAFFLLVDDWTFVCNQEHNVPHHHSTGFDMQCNVLRFLIKNGRYSPCICSPAEVFFEKQGHLALAWWWAPVIWTEEQSCTSPAGRAARIPLTTYLKTKYPRINHQLTIH